MACGGCEAARKARERKAAEAAARKAKQEEQARQQAKPLPEPAKARGVTQSFVLEMHDGRVLRFGSWLEAEATNVRSGYTGTVKPV